MWREKTAGQIVDELWAYFRSLGEAESRLIRLWYYTAWLAIIDFAAALVFFVLSPDPVWLKWAFMFLLLVGLVTPATGWLYQVTQRVRNQHGATWYVRLLTGWLMFWGFVTLIYLFGLAISGSGYALFTALVSAVLASPAAAGIYMLYDKADDPEEEHPGADLHLGTIVAEVDEASEDDEMPWPERWI